MRTSLHLSHRTSDIGIASHSRRYASLSLSIHNRLRLPSRFPSLCRGAPNLFNARCDFLIACLTCIVCGYILIPNQCQHENQNADGQSSGGSRYLPVSRRTSVLESAATARSTSEPFPVSSTKPRICSLNAIWRNHVKLPRLRKHHRATFHFLPLLRINLHPENHRGVLSCPAGADSLRGHHHVFERRLLMRPLSIILRILG